MPNEPGHVVTENPLARFEAGKETPFHGNHSNLQTTAFSEETLAALSLETDEEVFLALLDILKGQSLKVPSRNPDALTFPPDAFIESRPATRPKYRHFYPTQEATMPNEPVYLVNKAGDGAIRFKVGGGSRADQVLIEFLEQVGYHIATRAEYHAAVRKAKAADDDCAEQVILAPTVSMPHVLAGEPGHPHITITLSGGSP